MRRAVVLVLTLAMLAIDLALATAVAVACIVVVTASCATPPILTPKSGPGTDYPCGLHGHSCGNGACCDDGNDCGGVVTSCPANMCCFHGDNDRFARKRPPANQYPEVRQ